MSLPALRTVGRDTTPVTGSVRGVDHIGLTVPDLEAATRFFVDAFGATVLYDGLPRSSAGRRGAELESRLGVPAGTVQLAIRLLCLADGPGLELFEYRSPVQAPAVTPSDYGWQHVAFYVDDIDAAADAVIAAGGITLGEPRRLVHLEAGPANRFLYCRTPWGSTVELITYPDPQPYEHHTPRRRWRPAPTSLLRDGRERLLTVTSRAARPADAVDAPTSPAHRDSSE